MFAFVFASFSFFHFCRRSCFHIARPAIDFIITKMNGERQKEKFREDKRFYRLPTKRLCVLRALSAAEAKTSMTLRIFPPAFSSPLSLFRGIFFLFAPRDFFEQRSPLFSFSLSLFLLFIHSAQVRVNHDCAQSPPSRSTRRRSRRPSRFWTPGSLRHLARHLSRSHFRHIGFHLESPVAHFHPHLPTHPGLRSQRRRHRSRRVESDVSFRVHRRRFLDFAPRSELNAERSRTDGFLIPWRRCHVRVKYII